MLADPISKQRNQQTNKKKLSNAQLLFYGSKLILDVNEAGHLFTTTTRFNNSL